MQDIIYPNKASAKDACAKYVKELHDLQARLGVWEEIDDSCCSTYVHTKYHDEQGKTVVYCYVDA